MRTLIGNTETDYVTEITPEYELINGYFISQKKRANAMIRMNASIHAKFRNPPVHGAKLSDGDVHDLNNNTNIIQAAEKRELSA